MDIKIYFGGFWLSFTAQEWAELSDKTKNELLSLPSRRKP